MQSIKDAFNRNITERINQFLKSADTKYQSPHNIRVDPLSDQPNAAYQQMSWNHIEKLSVPDPSIPCPEGKVRLVCISDTHSQAHKMTIPDGDILIHAGDFTKRGGIQEVMDFSKFLASLPHKHKVVIAGNHELSFGYFDNAYTDHTNKRLLGSNYAEILVKQVEDLGIKHPKELLKDFTLLESNSIEVCGLKIWGSPWSAFFHGWAYNVKRGEDSLKLYDQIPDDTDVVITHGPPLGIGDMCCTYDRAGCVELYKTISERVKPKLHVFGHIHEDYGLFTDGTTLYANASSVNLAYQPLNPVICIDLPVPPRVLKE